MKRDCWWSYCARCGRELPRSVAKDQASQLGHLHIDGSGARRLPILNIDAGMRSEMLHAEHLPVGLLGERTELLELGELDETVLAIDRDIVGLLGDEGIFSELLNTKLSNVIARAAAGY